MRYHAGLDVPLAEASVRVVDEDGKIPPDSHQPPVVNGRRR